MVQISLIETVMGKYKVCHIQPKQSNSMMVQLVFQLFFNLYHTTLGTKKKLYTWSLAESLREGLSLKIERGRSKVRGAPHP